MRNPDLFLALPILATIFNIFFAALLTSNEHWPANGQPVPEEETCLEAVAGDECLSTLDKVVADQARRQQEVPDTEVASTKDDDEDDPMLRKMPGMDFKAYVRADISSFYKEPGSRVEQTPAFRGQACKFVNMSPERVTRYWIGPSGPVFQGHTGAWEAGGTSSFPSHTFTFTAPDTPSDVKATFKIVPGTLVYFYNPYVPDDRDDPAHGVTGLISPLDLETLTASDRAKYDAHIFNLEFGARYKSFTGGSEWLTMYPRDPPRNKIWRADYFGQLHQVVTEQTHLLSKPTEQELSRLQISQMRNQHGPALSQYRAPGTMTLNLTAVSVAPRIFEIRNFLSDVEVDHILHLVTEKHRLERSTTDGHLSNTRTSRTTWIPRESDLIMDSIFRRVSDALRFDEGLFRVREEGEPVVPPIYSDLGRRAINEQLQIVHYRVGEEYTAHYDFGYKGNPLVNHASRSINLCMYLNDVPAGGQTSFPRWRNAETTAGLRVEPEKGKAVIFYLVNPDGNMDALSQHAGMPVLQGEKYFANLWIWDPIRN